jgi:hypothetical protein
MARRIFEHHRLVDHRQFQMRCRIVDRYAGVLCQEHHYESHGCEGQTRIDRQFAMRQRVDDSRQQCTLRYQRRREEHHQQRRFGKKSDQHFAARAERAECRADIHRSQRHEYAREHEHPDQRDRIRGHAQRRIDAEDRDDRRCHRHRAELDIGRSAEQRRGIVRDHRILVQQLAQRPIRLQHTGAAAILQPRPALIDPADEQRRQHDRNQRLDQCIRISQSAHNTNASSASSVAKL